MRHIKANILFTILVLIISGCDSEKPHDLYYFSIEEPPAEEMIPLSLICEDIEYIPILSDTTIIPTSTSIRWSQGIFIIR